MPKWGPSSLYQIISVSFMNSVPIKLLFYSIVGNCNSPIKLKTFLFLTLIVPATLAESLVFERW